VFDTIEVQFGGNRLDHMETHPMWQLVTQQSDNEWWAVVDALGKVLPGHFSRVQQIV
jgi:hypothetical protein